MKITMNEIKKAQKWASRTCKENGSTGRLEMNVRTGAFTLTEYTSGSQYSQMPDDCIAIPFAPNQSDIDFAMGASSDAEYKRLLRESMERLAMKICKENGIEING